MTQRLALFGGSFDPVHKAHIELSLKVQEKFAFDQYHFLPCKMPLLKAPSQASPKQRLHMLYLSLKEHPFFQVDEREILRDTPSYMLLSLEAIKKEQALTSITLILGQDAFAQLNRWYHYEKVLDYAHLIVLNRHALQDNQAFSAEIKKLLLKHQSHDPSELKEKEAGLIYFFDAGDFDCASTVIRARIKEKKSVSELLLPEVAAYIKAQGLYQ